MLALLPATLSAASLWEALQQLAAQHQVRVTSRAGEALRVEPAAAVALPDPLDAALDRLLRDTPFRWRRLPTGMIVVEPRATARLRLEPLQIAGQVPAVGAAGEAGIDEPAPP